MSNSTQQDFKGATKIVDATKVETPQMARVDTSGISKALQQIIGSSLPQQTTTINPAQFITEQAGPRLKKLYESYEQLRDFAKHLNGLQSSSQLPEALGFEGLELIYKQEGVEKRVRLNNVAFVGHIAPALSTEMGVLLFAIQKEVDALNDITTRTKEQIKRARDAWTAANKDTKIEEVSDEPVTEPSAEDTPATKE
jgi:hypothetical protein